MPLRSSKLSEKQLDLRNATITLFSEMPTIGPNSAGDLFDLGITCYEDLAKRDAGKLYAELCERSGGHIDRCVLYVFRYAVEYAKCRVSGRKMEKGKQAWWHWSDKNLGLPSPPKTRKTKRQSASRSRVKVENVEGGGKVTESKGEVRNQHRKQMKTKKEEGQQVGQKRSRITLHSQNGSPSAPVEPVKSEKEEETCNEAQTSKKCCRRK